MDLASALQRLANYRTKNSRASREIFESGVVVFRNDALHKLGDDSAFFLVNAAHQCCNRVYYPRLAVLRVSSAGCR
jgi:hypothetical protein